MTKGWIFSLLGMTGSGFPKTGMPENCALRRPPLFGYIRALSRSG
jgi:hypothetical protein